MWLHKSSWEGRRRNVIGLLRKTETFLSSKSKSPSLPFFLCHSQAIPFNYQLQAITTYLFSANQSSYFFSSFFFSLSLSLFSHFCVLKAPFEYFVECLSKLNNLFLFPASSSSSPPFCYCRRRAPSFAPHQRQLQLLPPPPPLSLHLSRQLPTPQPREKEKCRQLGKWNYLESFQTFSSYDIFELQIDPGKVDIESSVYLSNPLVAFLSWANSTLAKTCLGEKESFFPLDK